MIDIMLCYMHITKWLLWIFHLYFRDDGWLEAENEQGEKGLVPINYLQVCNHQYGNWLKTSKYSTTPIYMGSLWILCVINIECWFVCVHYDLKNVRKCTCTYYMSIYVFHCPLIMLYYWLQVYTHTKDLEVEGLYAYM